MTTWLATNLVALVALVLSLIALWRQRARTWVSLSLSTVTMAGATQRRRVVATVTVSNHGGPLTVLGVALEVLHGRSAERLALSRAPMPVRLEDAGVESWTMNLSASDDPAASDEVMRVRAVVRVASRRSAAGRVIRSEPVEVRGRLDSARNSAKPVGGPAPAP